MKTSMLNAALLCLVPALPTQAPTFLRAEEGKADAPSASNRSEPATEAPGGVKPAKEKGLPFRGTLLVAKTYKPDNPLRVKIWNLIKDASIEILQESLITFLLRRKMEQLEKEFELHSAIWPSNSTINQTQEILISTMTI